MPNYNLTPLEKLIRTTKLTQKDFAKAVGTTAGNITNLKNRNNIKLNLFIKWCGMFGYDVKEFL